MLTVAAPIFLVPRNFSSFADSFERDSNVSAKRVIVEISTIADPKILDFYNS